MPPKRNDGGGDSPCTFWSQNVAAFAPRTLQSKLVPPTDCTPAHATPESASDREEADQCVGSHEWVPMTRETPWVSQDPHTEITASSRRVRKPWSLGRYRLGWCRP